MGKIKTKLILSVFILILLAGIAQAELSVDDNQVILEVDYDDLDDDEQELNLDQQFTLKNSAETEEVILTIIDVKSDYDVKFSTTTSDSYSFTFEGTEKTINLKTQIPVEADQGEHDIATLKITTSSGQETSIPIRTNVHSMLEIKKIYAYVNNFDNYKKAINDDETEVKNLSPGDKIRLGFRLENLFDEDYDYGDMEGTITLTLDDSEFGKDLDEEEDFDLLAGEDLSDKDQEIILNFEIPMDTEKGTYQLDVEIEAKDDNKAKFTIDWIIYLEVERETDDVRIESATLDPEEISCLRRSNLIVKVTNYGSSKQSHAALSILNTDLGIDMDYNFALERGHEDDNSHIEKIIIDLDKDFEVGTYPIDIISYYDYNVFGDKKIVYLEVKECTTVPSEPEAEPTPEPTSEPEAPKETIPEITTTAVAAPATPNLNAAATYEPLESTELKFEESTLMVVLMILAMGVTLIIIGILIVALVKQ